MTRKPGTQALVFVLITVLIDVIGFGMIMPVLPTLIVHLTGEPLNRTTTYGGWARVPLRDPCSSPAPRCSGI